MLRSQIIPWQSKKEWIEVYENVYSGDYSRTKEAVEKIGQWKNCMRLAFRPGLDVTRAILKVLLNDDEFFPQIEHPLQAEQLQLMYSAEIMRFLNLVTNIEAETTRKVSLYGKAKSLKIPDWVVNIRHQMAHGTTLPPLPALRMAARFILQWLQVYYWEEERNEMQETVIDPEVDVNTEYLTMLITMYVILKEQSILGFKLVRDIQDPLIKAEIEFWKTSRNTIKISSSKFGLSTIDQDIFNLLKAINRCIRNSDSALIRIVDFMIRDSVEHSGMRREVWNGLVRTIHSLHKFPEVISLFHNKSFNGLGEESYQAGIWTVELCKSLEKRYKVEQMAKHLLEQTASQKFKNVQQINLGSAELKEFRKILLKKRLNITSQSDNKIRACIFLRVEEKYPHMKGVLRLKEPIFPQHWELIDLLKEISFYPTDFSQPSLQALYNVMKWPINSHYFNCLLKLLNIYRGEVVPSSKKKKKVYNVKKLKDLMNDNHFEITQDSGSDSDSSVENPDVE